MLCRIRHGWAKVGTKIGLCLTDPPFLTGSMIKPRRAAWKNHAIAQITKHGGLGALYRLVDGAPDLSNDSAIIWLSRPRGVKWREALASICGRARQSLTVWRRQMVLGPAKEFAIVGPPDLALDIPQGWESFTVRRRWLGPR